MNEDKDVRELHRLYNKHEPWGNQLPRKRSRRFPYVGICSCGDVFVYDKVAAHWEPLAGSSLTAGIIEEYPGLYQVLEDYHNSFLPDAKAQPDPWSKVAGLVDEKLITLLTPLAPRAPVLSWAEFAKHRVEEKI
jgi:hypothetical protein